MDYSLDESPRKTTSAGYRFPSRRSEYHNKCVPAEQRQPAAAPPVQPTTKASDPKAAAKCDSVTLDEIWKESVHSEKRGAKDWEHNWGFMTEFDERGRPKSAKELPEEVNVFSTEVPNTNAGVYGSRVNSEMGQMMAKLEFQFTSGTRKKKLDKEMVCY